jgi:hypothetical protein
MRTGSAPRWSSKAVRSTPDIRLRRSATSNAFAISSGQIRGRARGLTLNAIEQHVGRSAHLIGKKPGKRERGIEHEHDQ